MQERIQYEPFLYAWQQIHMIIFIVTRWMAPCTLVMTAWYIAGIFFFTYWSTREKPGHNWLMFGFELLVRVLSISCLSVMRIVTVKAPARLNSDGHSNFIHGSLMFGFCFWLEDVYDALHKEISNFFSFFFCWGQLLKIKKWTLDRNIWCTWFLFRSL